MNQSPRILRRRFSFVVRQHCSEQLFWSVRIPAPNHFEKSRNSSSVHTRAPGAKPAAAKFGFTANAYGSYEAGPLGITAAPSATSGIGCTTQAGQVSTNDAAATTLPSAGGVGAVKRRAQSIRTQTSVASAAYEEVATADLLGGLIEARAIQVTSTTSHTALGFHTGGSTTMARLSVAGHAISGAIRPNTVVTLPGLGSVTLNVQSAASNSVRGSQGTTAVDVRITVANSLHLPIGVRLIMGQASSGLGGPVPAALSGSSYGSSVTAGVSSISAGSGPLAVAGMACFGTEGKVVTNSLAGTSVPNVVTVGAIPDTARGTVTPTSASAETTSTVGGANLLASVVSAGTIKADAHALSGGAKADPFSDAGSLLLKVVVAGHGGRLDNVPANTVLNIPGVGVLYLHRVIRTAGSVEVRMIELVVTAGGNQLPIGADIKVGVARAAIR